MTRPCGCGGNAAADCNCAIQAGTNTTVTGVGTAQSPYIVSSERAALTVTDSATVDHTLTGNGATATPYNLRSDVRVSADAGNAVVQNVDGLYVAAGSAGAIVVGCGLSGAGTSGSPLRLATPQTVSGYVAQGATVTLTGAQFNAGLTVTQASMLTITNPSACQSMIVQVQGSARLRFSSADAFTSAWTAQMIFTLLRGGVDSGVFQSLQVGRRVAAAEYYWAEENSAAPITLAPGGSVVLGMRLDGVIAGPSGVDAALYNFPSLSVIGHLV